MSEPKFPVKFKPRYFDQEGKEIKKEARGDSADPVQLLDDLISQWDDF